MAEENILQKLFYNPETGIFLWRGNYGSRARAGHRAGTPSIRGSLVIRLNKKLYYAHRLAWLCTYGEWPAEVIDHINGNPADNRLVNLRACSQKENTRNVKRHKDTRSGLKGAYRDKQRWTSRIFVNGKNISLGNFNTPEAAAAAYDKAAIKYHGEFARTN